MRTTNLSHRRVPPKLLDPCLELPDGMPAVSPQSHGLTASQPISLQPITPQPKAPQPKAPPASIDRLADGLRILTQPLERTLLLADGSVTLASATHTHTSLVGPPELRERLGAVWGDGVGHSLTLRRLHAPLPLTLGPGVPATRALPPLVRSALAGIAWSRSFAPSLAASPTRPGCTRTSPLVRTPSHPLPLRVTTRVPATGRFSTGRVAPAGIPHILHGRPQMRLGVAHARIQWRGGPSPRRGPLDGPGVTTGCV